MKEFWKAEPDVDSYLSRVDEKIRGAVDSSSEYIRPMLIDTVSNRGKMLRPAMIYISSLIGKHSEQLERSVLRLGTAMEMLHIASLVHDDVIDESAVRRGIPTLQQRVGVKKAVIAGDYLLTRAFTQLTGQIEGVEPAVVQSAICRLCDSEIDQDSELWDFSVSRRRYLRRIAGKTASLFSLSLYLGAAASGAPQEKVLLLKKIGYLIGIFFQIQDDILDYTGNSSSMGKPAGNDLKCGIATLPLIYGLERDSGGKLKSLIAGRKKISTRRAGRIIEETRRLGGLEAAEITCSQFQQRTLEGIQALGDSETARLLTMIVRKLDKRIS